MTTRPAGPSRGETKATRRMLDHHLPSSSRITIDDQSSYRAKDKRNHASTGARFGLSAATFLPSIFSFTLGCCSTMAFLVLLNDRSSFFASPSFVRPLEHSNDITNTSCLVSFGSFHGQEYRTRETVASQCLVESKFVKIQQHAVRFDDSTSIIPDWIWIDYHERINVLVQTDGFDAAATNSDEIRFTVLQQTKYALEGQQSIALVGGIVEPGEQPHDAARREVQEEMHLECQNLVFLGRFRTDVNRGMGWTNGFLAQQCSKAMSAHTSDMSAPEQVGEADTERQDMITISLPELRRLVIDGRFVEIQWTAIASLALLHLEEGTK